MVLMGASECNVGGKGPNVDDPEKGTAQCVVVDRVNMPNGTLNIKVDCNGGGTEDLGEGNIYAFTSQGDYPMCRVGAAWPGCKAG
jgi:hypothetical protein